MITAKRRSGGMAWRFVDQCILFIISVQWFGGNLLVNGNLALSTD